VAKIYNSIKPAKLLHKNALSPAVHSTFLSRSLSSSFAFL